MRRFKDIENKVETESINMEKYVEELSQVCWDMIRATGTMFEQEHMRFINMCTAAGSGGNGGAPQSDHGAPTRHEPHDGQWDKSLFRQWR